VMPPASTWISMAVSKISMSALQVCSGVGWMSKPKTRCRISGTGVVVG